MCTSVALNIGGLYFGRNMDLEGSFDERVVIAPRRFSFGYRRLPEDNVHFAMIGMAAVVSGYPLFADAMNEKGLCMAGLNFPGNAVYGEGEDREKANVTPFELIPWVLGRCATVAQAEALLRETKLISLAFFEMLPLTPLHWHIADGSGSLTVEPMADGLRVYRNSAGVLANNPPFPYHLANLARYAHLGTGSPSDAWTEDAGAVSMGLCGVGLPGDYSSASRFVRAAFLKKNLTAVGVEDEAVDGVFRILGAVAPPKGCVMTSEDKPHYTTYACCMDTARASYFYRRHGDLRFEKRMLEPQFVEGNSLVF